MRIFLLTTLFFSLISTSVAIGHEFWISPHKYSVVSGEPLVADLRVGSNFEGSVFAFIPKNIVRFDLVNGEEIIEVTGRIGDRPALNMAVPHDGLWIAVHETTDSKLTWREWEKFTAFVKHKDLTGTLENHATRNLPQVDFSETYRRFAKSLIAVGDAQGSDREVGLRTEIVAEANPYTDDLRQGLPVRVLFEGAPRQHVQVEIFQKNPAGEVTVTTTRTDENGRAVIPMTKGDAYIIDAVVMLPLQASDPLMEPTWTSLWAGLTFSVPQ